MRGLHGAAGATIAIVKVTEAYAAASRRPVTLCDFSPPRTGDPTALQDVRLLDTDFVCVAYAPGRAVRADSLAVAAWIQRDTGKGVVCNLSPRDQNRLALQNHLLGAELLGVENVLVLQGDAFSERDRERVRAVDEYTATGLLTAIGQLNQGVDFRGSKLAAPTDICAGGAVDLGKGIEAEVKLARRKVEAGAQFLATQPIFDLADRERFYEGYRALTGGNLPIPVFWGLQVLVQDGVVFASVPQQARDQLTAGRDGVEMALELLEAFKQAGVRGIYLVPPILRGGARDYAAAGRVLATIQA